MIRTAIYMRVSSRAQAKEGDSIPAQRAALRAYIDSKPDLVFAGEYLDDGVSGTKEDRDELQRMLEDVRAGKIDLIAVTKLDRLHRGLKNFLMMQDTLDKHGVNWLAIWEPIYDTSTPQGRLIINQMMSIAQFEAENTGSRIRQVQAYKVTQGEVISGTVPLGYSIENKHLVPNELAPAVLDLFRYYDSNGNLAGMVRYAMEKYGLDRSPSTWRRFLKNEKYMGVYRGNPNYCPAIVPPELFQNVQRKLKMNIKNYPDRDTYVFAGLIVCYSCGRKLTGMHIHCRSRNGTPHTYKGYRCHRRYEPNSHCSGTRIRFESTLEKYLISHLREQIAGHVEQIKAATAPAVDNSKKVAAVERKLKRLKELYVNDLITLDEYKADKEKYESELATLEDTAPPPAPDLSKYNQIMDMENIEEMYWTLTPVNRQYFWRELIKEIHWSKDGIIEPIFL